MAALEVVYNRLEDSGLDSFCLQLHGLKTNKKDLLASVAQRIDYKVSAPENLNQKEKQLLQSRNELVTYSKVLSERVGPDELPLYDVAWRIEVLKQELPEEIDELAISVDGEIEYESFNALKNQLNDLGDEWSDIPEDARYAWSGYLPNKYKEKYSQTFMESNQFVIESLKHLDDYLLQKNAQSSVPLLFEAGRSLELTKTAPGIALKDFPIGTNARVIRNVVSHDSLSEFKVLLNAIGAYLNDVNKVNKTFDYSNENSKKYASLLLTHSKLLANIALDSSVAINQIQEEKEHFVNVVAHLEMLADDSKYVLNILNSVARGLEDYEVISTVADDLVKGPIELSLYANVQHLKTSITNYLDQAKNKCTDLENRIAELSIFNVDRIKQPDEIESISNTISLNVGKMFSIFNGEYRRAKKRIKSILKNPSDFDKSEIFVDKLRSLYVLTHIPHLN